MYMYNKQPLKPSQSQMFDQGFDQGLGKGTNHKYNVQYYPA